MQNVHPHPWIFHYYYYSSLCLISFPSALIWGFPLLRFFSCLNNCHCGCCCCCCCCWFLVRAVSAWNFLSTAKQVAGKFIAGNSWEIRSLLSSLMLAASKARALSRSSWWNVNRSLSPSFSPVRESSVNMQIFVFFSLYLWSKAKRKLLTDRAISGTLIHWLKSHKIDFWY